MRRERRACARLLGIDPAGFIRGWISRGRVGGTLIIDEASMATVENVNEALEAFDRIVLVGDHGQLPPVKGAPALDKADSVELIEIHRQAAGSPVLRLAHRVRAGDRFSAMGVRVDSTGPDPEGGPVLVWSNRSRIMLTKRLRKLKGYPSDEPQPGEPLICRATEAPQRARGFSNNMPCVYAGGGRVETGDGRVLMAGAMHFDEIDGDGAPRGDAIPFRFGHVITVHTAQGSEWPAVQIYNPDRAAYARSNPREATRWLYTAITRAKESVRFFC